MTWPEHLSPAKLQHVPLEGKDGCEAMQAGILKDSRGASIFWVTIQVFVMPI